MQHKKLAIPAMAAASALALTGCGASSDDTVELTFLAPIYSDATEGYWEDLIASFEDENPGITIDLQMTAWADITQEINTMVSTQQIPDILNYNSFVSFADDDLLLSLDEVLPEELAADFIPALTENGTLDGEVYGLPMIASVRAMFYNTDIFEEAGVEAPPTTWDELVDATEAIKDAGYAGWGLGWGNSELEADLSGFMWNNGGDWKDGDDWTIDSPENAEALQFLHDLVNTYAVTQDGGGSADRDEVWQLFGQGQIGMVQGSNFLPTILESQGSEIEYGIAPMPTNGGNESASLAVEDYLVAFNTTEHPEEVGRFLAYFFEPDNYETFLENEGMLPVTQSTADQMAESDPSQAPFLELLETSRFYPTNDPVWPSVQNEVRTTLGSAIGGQISVEEQLANLQSMAEAG